MKKIVIFPLIGWLIARFLLTWLRYINISYLTILPVWIISILVILFFPFLINRIKNLKSTLFIVMGMISESIWVIIIREKNINMNFFSFLVFEGTIIGLIILFVVLFITYYLNVKKVYKNRINFHFITPYITLLTIFYFRISSFLIRSVPNENRSIIIGGYEIHHGISGLILITMLLNLRLSNVLRNNKIFSILYAVFSGFIYDQCSFLLITNITDNAYFEFKSYFGAFLLGIINLFFWRSHFEKEKTISTQI